MKKKRICNPILWICLIVLSGLSLSISQEHGHDRVANVLLDSAFSINLGQKFLNIKCHCVVTRAPQDVSIYNFQFSTTSPRSRLFAVIDTADRSSSEFHFADLNFDGYEDLCIEVEFYRNPVYSTWLFNPDSERFLAWEHYPDNVGKLTLDPISKTMTFSNYSFSAGQRQTWTQVYGVSGTVPFLSKEEVITDYSLQESFYHPDSTVAKTDEYGYDLSALTPLLQNHTENTVITKNNLAYVTTILEKRVRGKMTFIKKTQTTRKAE